jgi:hypothetical protein
VRGKEGLSLRHGTFYAAAARVNFSNGRLRAASATSTYSNDKAELIDRCLSANHHCALITDSPSGRQTHAIGRIDRCRAPPWVQGLIAATLPQENLGRRWEGAESISPLPRLGARRHHRDRRSGAVKDTAAP